MNNEEIRKECLDDVSRPGKFEGEPIYSPYFYEAIMNGECDETFSFLDDGCYDCFIITDKDVDIFPELEKTYAVICHESDIGFFSCFDYETEKEYKEETENLMQQEIEEIDVN